MAYRYRGLGAGGMMLIVNPVLTLKQTKTNKSFKKFSYICLGG